MGQAKLLIQVIADAKQALREIGSFGKQVRNIGGNLRSQGASLTAGLTVPLAATGAAAFKLAGDFEQSMVRSTAVMGELSSAMRDDLAATALRTARDVKVAQSEMAQGYGFLAVAGFNAEQSIVALPAAARFAKAGAFDLKTGVDLVTDAQKALGLASADAQANLENLTRVSDVLVKANTLANASTEQFAVSLTNQAATAARTYGKDIEEVVSVLAIYANAGVKGEEAGTKFFQVLRDLSRAANENEHAFRLAGVRVFDQAGNMRHLGDIVEDLEKRLAGMSDQQKRAELSMLGINEKSLQATLTLVGFSKEIRAYDSSLRQAAGTTDEMAARQLDNLNDQLFGVQLAFQEAAIELGEAFTPALRDGLTVVEDWADQLIALVKSFDDLPDPAKQTILLIGGIVAALGPLLIISGLVVTAFGSLITITSTIVGLVGGGLIASVIAAVNAWSEYNAEAERAAAVTMEIAQGTQAASEHLRELARQEKDVQAAIEKTNEKIQKEEELLAGIQEKLESGIFKNTIQTQKAIAAIAGRIAEARVELDALGKKMDEIGQKREIAEVYRIFERLAAATEANSAGFAVFGDKAKLLSSHIRSTEAALSALVGKLDANDHRVVALRERVKQLTEQLKELNAETGRTEQIERGQESMRLFSENMENARTVALALGDSQGALNDQIRQGEADLRLYSESLLLSGASHDEIIAKTAGMREELEKLRAEQHLSQNAWSTWFEQAKISLGTVEGLLRGVADSSFAAFQELSSGIGQSLGRALVFGESFGKSFEKVVKNMAANFIASLVQMGIQALAFWVLQKVLGLAGLVTQTSIAVGRASAGAASWVFATIPWPASAVIAPIAAAQAGGIVGALGAAGILGLDIGGFVRSDGIAMLHANEVVTPIDRVPDLMRAQGIGLGGGDLTVNMIVDGQKMATRTVPYLREALNEAMGSGRF